MYMAEVMMIGGVQLDELMVGTVDVSEEEDSRRVAAADVANVGDRSLELGAAVELLLIRGFHVLGAPAPVPDGRGDLRLWRLVDLVEEHPRLLRPHRVNGAVEARLFAVEFCGVESNVGRRVRGVEVQMVKVGQSGRRRRGRWRGRSLLDAAGHTEDQCGEKESCPEHGPGLYSLRTTMASWRQRNYSPRRRGTRRKRIAADFRRCTQMPREARDRGLWSRPAALPDLHRSA